MIKKDPIENNKGRALTGKIKNIFKIEDPETVKDNQLEKQPAFYKSMAKNPEMTRLLPDMEVRKNMFRRVETVEITTEVDSGFANITYFHGLGYLPYIYGTYKMTDSSVPLGTNYPEVLRGIIPEDRSPDFGIGTAHSLYISLVTKNKFIIRVITGVSSAKFQFRLYLLREPVFG
jgi:hypothetical protein